MRRNRRRILAGLLSLTLFLTCFEQMTVQVLANELEQQELEDNDDEKNIDEEEIELSEGEEDEALSEESEIDDETGETDQTEGINDSEQKEETDNVQKESDEETSDDSDMSDNKSGIEDESNLEDEEKNDEDTSEEGLDVLYSIRYQVAEGQEEWGSVSNELEELEKEQDIKGAIAIPKEGYEFAYWSNMEGDVVSENANFIPADFEYEIYIANFCQTKKNFSLQAASINNYKTPKPLPALTGNKRNDAANIAYSQIGYQESYYDENGNYSSSGNYNAYGPKGEWCVYFARWCVMQAGLESSKWLNTGSTNALIAWFQKQGRWHNRDTHKWSVPSRGSKSTGIDDGYVPQPGDFAAVENGMSGGDTSSNNAPDHTALVYKVDSSYIYTVEGNVGDKVVERRYRRSDLHYSSSTYIVGFGEPDFGGGTQDPVNHTPQGMFDSAGGGEGTIEVNGWAFDRDDYSKQLMIHLYVGGPAGSGAFYQMLANQSRPDVANAYPSAQVNCGFNGSIKVNERGSQQVYAYAIDAQDPWKNTLLGVKTVTIKNVPFSMQFGVNSLNLNEGKETSFSCKFTGDGIHNIGYTFSDTSIATLPRVSNMDWSKGTCFINVKALKIGKTTLTIYLLDNNNKELYSKAISVTVIQPVTSVSLNKSSTSLEVGKTERLTASVAPSNASNKNITWSSSNTNIATVSNGVITARSAGTATITATAADGSGKKATCSVTVKKASTPFSITFDQTGVNLNKGNTNTLNITFKGDGIYTLGYAFDDSTIASATWGTVDYTKGTTSIVLKGLKAGRALLTIHLKDSAGKSLYSKNINISINVPLQNITLNKTSGRLKVGETDSLTVSYYPSDTTVSKTVTWTSSNTNIATVSGGKITAKNEGTATITATVQNKKVTYSLTVVPAVIKVSNISLNNTNIQLYLDSSIDKSRELSAYISPSNATNKEIVWSSSNTKVASVSNKGMVTAVSSGTATITATAVDGSGKKASCLVTVKNSSWDGSVNINSNEIVVAERKESTRNQVIYGGRAADITITFGDNSIAEYRLDGDLSYGTGSEEYTYLNFFVKGIKAGKTTMTVTAYDDNGKILGNKSIPVTVIRKVTGISFDKSYTIIKVGESEQLKVNIVPADATVQDVSWETFEDSIVCVDGVVTGNRMDVAKVRVKTKDGNYTDTIDVVVVDDLKLDTMMSSVPDIVIVEAGEKNRIELPYQEYRADFDWEDVTVEDEVIASARVGHMQGVGGSICYLDVTGNSEGYTKVRISYEWAGKSIYSKDIQVQVVSKEIPVQTIRLNVSNVYLAVGQSKTVSATVYPTDATNKNIVWSSGDSDVVSVIGGTVYGMKEGTAWIRAISEDGQIMSEEIPVYVSRATDGIWLSENHLMMMEGETQQLIARIDPEDDSKKIKFTSSDTQIAAVDDSGNIAAIKRGTAVITASVDEGAVQSHCVVTVTADVGEVFEDDIPDSGIPNGIWAAYERSVLYTGAAVMPDIRVYDGKTRLTRGTDYSLEYKNNVNAGTAYIFVKGKGKYNFNNQFEFTIIGADISDVSVKLKSPSYFYTGREVFPELVVTDDGVDLVEGKDYTSSYLNNISVGTGTAILNGTGRYAGEVCIDFEIKKKEAEPRISIPERLTIRVDESIEIPVSIIPEDAVVDILIISSDEEIVSVNSDRYVITGHEPGTAILSVHYNEKIKYCTVTVTQSSVQSEVLSEDMPDNGTIPDGIWVAGVGDKTYVGSPIKQSFRVYDREILLQEGKDYSVAYKNNKTAYMIQDKDNLSKNDTNKAPRIVITMKGIYTGRKVLYFDIVPADISTAYVPDFSAAYDKKGQKPIPTVSWNKIKLRNKKDFTVEYRNMKGNIVNKCTEPGTYSIIIRGKGNFGSDTEKRLSFVVADTLNGEVPVSKLSISVDKKTSVYRGGNPVIPVITVKNGKNVLEVNKDYKVSFFSNTEVGTGYLSITGMGKYTGVKTIGFSIAGVSIAKYKVSKLDTIVYNGCAQKQSNYILEAQGDKEGSLLEGKDYTVSYTNNVNAGTATISFTGINELSGKLKKSFKIVPLHLEEALTNNFNSISVEGYNARTGMSVITAEYKKNGAKPIPAVYYRDGNGASRLLREGVDFRISYKNNKKVYERKADDEQYDAPKAPTIVITGIGNFTGTLRIPFCIAKQDLSGKTRDGISIAAADMKYKYKKNNFMQTVKVLDADGKKLIPKKDYTLRYLDEHGQEIMRDTVMPINSVITVEVTANKNSMWYSGTRRATFMLKGEVKDIAKASFKIRNKEYTGAAVNLTENDFVNASYGSRDNRVTVPLVVSDNGDGTYMTASGEKTDGGFEIIGYSNNIRRGKACVTIRGVGVYSGTRVLTYKIGSRSINTFWNGLYISLKKIVG